MRQPLVLLWLLHDAQLCFVVVGEALAVEGTSFANHTRDLCTPWQRGDVDFELNFTVLPSTARAFACDDRRPSNFMLVEGFFTAGELKRLKAYEKKQSLNPVGPNVPNWVDQRITSFLGAGMSTEKIYRRSHHFFQESDDPDMSLDENIHKDILNAPDRFATMIAYITEPKSGGHTLFPYVGSVSEFGPLRDDNEWQESLKLLPESWENRDQNGVAIDAGGFEAYASSALPQIQDKMNNMCTALRISSEQGLKYPYFGVAPRPGAAIIWWHWRKLRPADISQEWISVIPDWWNPAAWHRRCACKGKRLVLTSLIHCTALKCAFDSASHPFPSGSTGPQRPPRRADCKGFLKDKVHGCGYFNCEDTGGSLKVTYSKRGMRTEL